jgi:N4-gp56 family major capsid protein
MPVNSSGAFQADVESYIAQKTLPLARRRLVAFQFGDPLTLPKGRGVVYQAARWNRVPLPYAPLSEGVPPAGQEMSVTMVTATVLQWGDKITISDIAEMTIKHPMFSIAKELCALAVAETLDRNTYNNLMGGTQINYVNSRGARANLVAGDVLNLHEINRLYAQLSNLGAPRYMGDEQTNEKIAAESGGSKASADPRGLPHYTAIVHPFVVQDVRENSTFVTASSYSDINKLYNAEIGELGGIRFCESNMVPFWTGNALIQGVAGSAGALATNATYYTIVTASDTQNQYESWITQVSAATSVAGPNGSIAITLPSTPTGFTFNVYIGTTTSPDNLATTAAGPTTSPLQGQATQLAGGQTVILTGIGASQVPPAAPAAGVTVYPTLVFGRGAYGQIMLDDIKYTFLKDADKSDVLNMLRVVGWKVMYGTILLNQLFFGRIESTSAFSGTFG